MFGFLRRGNPNEEERVEIQEYLRDILPLAETLDGEFAEWLGGEADRAPQPLVTRLWMALSAAMQVPAVKDLLLRDGSDIVTSTPEDFRQMIESDYAKYGKLRDLLKGAQ